MTADSKRAAKTTNIAGNTHNGAVTIHHDKPAATVNFSASRTRNIDTSGPYPTRKVTVLSDLLIYTPAFLATCSSQFG